MTSSCEARSGCAGSFAIAWDPALSASLRRRMTYVCCWSYTLFVFRLDHTRLNARFNHQLAPVGQHEKMPGPVAAPQPQPAPWVDKPHLNHFEPSARSLRGEPFL